VNEGEAQSVRLDGKSAVVTGAGRGLGRAYAITLARAGCSVVVNDIDDDAANEVVRTIISAGGRAVAEVAGVGTAEIANAIVGRARAEYGRLDVLCTNAGILRDRVLWKMTDEEFDAVIRTHLYGTFTCARAAAVALREQGDGGSLILVSSVAGQLGNFGQTNYAAAKAGIAAMARTWALELKRFGIRVNALVPNALTRMVATIPGFEDLYDKAERGVALPSEVRAGMWMGTADDVAPMVVFLASDAARRVTGQCIGIGGDKIALWAHPSEKAVAYRSGGWTPESIAEAWEVSVGAQLEPIGIPFLVSNKDT
jgi:NAD(P)-dependent dehydrogenase (short-subunit alcohol dehydrogenase family)